MTETVIEPRLLPDSIVKLVRTAFETGNKDILIALGIIDPDSQDPEEMTDILYELLDRISPQ